ncbi:MAG: hypothetical protein RSD40_05860 [Bacilli bacterium]
MKILEIKNNKGYFLNSENEYQSISEIDADELYHLTDLIIENEEIEIDEETEEVILNEEVQRIIYNNIVAQLLKFKNQRENIINEIDSKFNETMNKYKAELE